MRGIGENVEIRAEFKREHVLEDVGGSVIEMQCCLNESVQSFDETGYTDVG